MPETTVVISRSQDKDPARRTFEDALVASLRASGAARVLVVPSAYCMSDVHPGVKALRAITGDIVYASWHHPRASYWLLRARGVEGEPVPTSRDEGPCACAGTRCIHPVDLRQFASPEAAAEMLLTLSGASGGSHAASVREIEGDVAPRWYPVLDDSGCTTCRQCHDFCLFGVYTLDDDGRPVVTSPDRCKCGCVACARICPAGAIIYPDSADEGIAGDPDKRPAAVPVDAARFFANSREPCPVCGCACDCERSTDATAPPGKTVCPACGCLCDPKALCRSKANLASRAEAPGKSGSARDDLDDLIDALDELDV